MTLTVKVKLLTTKEHELELKNSMFLFSKVCNKISELSMEFKIFKKYDIHQWFYLKLRSEFPDAGSQFVIRAIANVASAFSREKILHQYREDGAMKLDHRMYSIKDNAVSVWTTAGRIWIPVKWTKKHLALKRKFGAAEIILDRPTGIYYIVFSYKPQLAPQIEVQDVIGVDKGIVNIATTSTGKNFSGAEVDKARLRYRKHKRSLQKRGTKSAKRRLKKVARKESRFRADVNHQISKQIVKEAKDTGCAISLEDLTGITKRTTVRKEQRDRHKGWSFYQLDTFIQYKADLAGVLALFIDPTHTSQQCPECGTITRKNRKVRDDFKCVGCGYVADADFVGATNIRSRGVILLESQVSHPIVATVQA